MHASEPVTPIAPSPPPDSAGARAGLAALTIGVIVNIAWLLAAVVVALRLALD